MMGSKFSVEEGEFALAFKEFDPELKETLFLSSGSWLAHISNKIQFNVNRGHAILFAPIQGVQNEAVEIDREKQELWELIVESRCVSCLKNISTTYIVINTDFFNATLENEIFTFKQFHVYRSQVSR